MRYVSHLIKLAWLSPAMIERIFKGEITHGLTLGKLMKHITTLSWAEQESLFSRNRHLLCTISHQNSITGLAISGSRP